MLKTTATTTAGGVLDGDPEELLECIARHVMPKPGAHDVLFERGERRRRREFQDDPYDERYWLPVLYSGSELSAALAVLRTAGAIA